MIFSKSNPMFMTCAKTWRAKIALVQQEQILPERKRLRRTTALIRRKSVAKKRRSRKILLAVKSLRSSPENKCTSKRAQLKMLSTV